MGIHLFYYIRYCIEPAIYVIMSSTYRQEFSDFIQKIFSKHDRIQIQNDDFRYWFENCINVKCIIYADWVFFAF